MRRNARLKFVWILKIIIKKHEDHYEWPLSTSGGYFFFFSVFSGVCFKRVDSSEALFLISSALEAIVR